VAVVETLQARVDELELGAVVHEIVTRSPVSARRPNATESPA